MKFFVHEKDVCSSRLGFVLGDHLIQRALLHFWLNSDQTIFLNNPRNADETVVSAIVMGPVEEISQHKVGLETNICYASAGVPNSNCFLGQIRTCEVTRGPHYDADAKIAVPELTRNRFYILFPAKRFHEQ